MSVFTKLWGHISMQPIVQCSQNSSDDVVAMGTVKEILLGICLSKEFLPSTT